MLFEKCDEFHNGAFIEKDCVIVLALVLAKHIQFLQFFLSQIKKCECAYFPSMGKCNKGIDGFIAFYAVSKKCLLVQENIGCLFRLSHKQFYLSCVPI